MALDRHLADAGARGRRSSSLSAAQAGPDATARGCIAGGVVSGTWLSAALDIALPSGDIVQAISVRSGELRLRLQRRASAEREKAASTSSCGGGGSGVAKFTPEFVGAVHVAEAVIVRQAHAGDIVAMATMSASSSVSNSAPGATTLLTASKDGHVKAWTIDIEAESGGGGAAGIRVRQLAKFVCAAPCVSLATDGDSIVVSDRLGSVYVLRMGRPNGRLLCAGHGIAAAPRRD